MHLIKPALFTLLLLPLCWMAWQGLAGQLGANPIEAGLRQLGHWTMRLLLLTLALGALAQLCRWQWPLAIRRMVGLFAFFYACIHLLVYVGLDQFGEPSAILDDLRYRPYILLGMLAWLILLLLSVSSLAGIKRHLARQWHWLHRLIYLALPLALAHAFLVQKTLNPQAMLYTALFILILLMRWLPPRRT